MLPNRATHHIYEYFFANNYLHKVNDGTPMQGMKYAQGQQGT